jgi:hypothetical protein
MNPLKMKRLAAWILCAAVSAGSVLLGAPVSPRRGNGAPNVPVSGTVTDGSGHGWPLYARIEITSASTVPVVVFSDPVTGAYTADLPDATAYTFAVTAVGQGYAAGGGAVVTAGSPVVADWTLVAGALCNAPGYGPGSFGPPVLAESFDAGVLPAGWTVQNDSQDGGQPWTIFSGADPCGQFSDNRTGGSGPFALVNSNCDAFVTDDTFLVTPPIDLSSSANAAIRWANDFINTGVTAIAEVDVSADGGGATWTNVWRADETISGPGTLTADMSFAAGHAGVQARFHYQGFWAWWWQVDDVTVGPFTCLILPGGLVVGNVSDANTGLGLNGATVTNLADDSSATTVAAPGQGDGFYSLFAAGSGSQAFEGSAQLHTSLTKNATVTLDTAVRLDFSLAAGILAAAPRPLSAVVSPGGTQSLTLDVTNTGTGDGSFVLHEVDVAPSAQTTVSRPAIVLSLEDRKALRQQFTLGPLDARAARSGLPKAPANVPLAAGAGNLVNTFATGLVSGYGLAYDTDANRLWVSNPDAPQAQLFGDGLDYEFLPDGTATGETIGFPSGEWEGDGTYNARTGMIWQVNVAYITGAPDQCIFEIDPVAKVVTGRQICGPWGNFPPLAGLAYDYATDTYYTGDSLGGLTHVDNTGNLLDSGYLPGVQISGLAYNPTTRHLYVESFSGPFDVYVLDPSNGYAVLSGSYVTSNGVRVLGNRGVSLEADCSGHLWTYDVFNNVVYEYESGEPGWCVNDIPWLSEDPASGTIPGSGGGARPAGSGNTLPVAVTFDSTGLLPGLRLRSLVFTTDTPDPVAPVPVDFTVLFSDVPQDSFAWNFIYGAAGAGVMPGCAPQAPLFLFCPAEVVTRRSMAGYIERAVHGALTPPPVYLAEFNDVLLGSFNADYIQGLVEDAITAGCGGGNYCPDVPVTRAQMAVFVWKGQHGSEPPTPCTPPGTFGDVTCPGGFAVDYIEGIYAEGITAGCGNGNYCPNASITNAQMAVFLVKAFSIPYLP